MGAVGQNMGNTWESVNTFEIEPQCGARDQKHWGDQLFGRGFIWYAGRCVRSVDEA